MRILSFLRGIDGLLAAFEKGLAVLLTAALILSAAAAVVARDLLRIPSQNLLEAAPLLVLWLALIGASLALDAGRHIRLELAMRLMPPAARRAARLVVGLSGAVLMGLLGYLAVDFVRGEIDLFGPRGWAAVIFPIFFAAAALRFLVQAATGLERAPETGP